MSAESSLVLGGLGDGQGAGIVRGADCAMRSGDDPSNSQGLSPTTCARAPKVSAILLPPSQHVAD